MNWARFELWFSKRLDMFCHVRNAASLAELSASSDLPADSLGAFSALLSRRAINNYHGWRIISQEHKPKLCGQGRRRWFVWPRRSGPRRHQGRLAHTDMRGMVIIVKQFMMPGEKYEDAKAHLGELEAQHVADFEALPVLHLRL